MRWFHWRGPPILFSAALRPRDTRAGDGHQAQGVVIIALADSDLRSGANAQLLQELSQLAVALINALHGITVAGLGSRIAAAVRVCASRGAILAWADCRAGKAPPRPSLRTSMASKSLETACSSRSASSCTLYHSMPKTSCNMRSIRWWRMASAAGNLAPCGCELDAAVGAD